MSMDIKAKGDPYAGSPFVFWWLSSSFSCLDTGKRRRKESQGVSGAPAKLAGCMKTLEQRLDLAFEAVGIVDALDGGTLAVEKE